MNIVLKNWIVKALHDIKIVSNELKLNDDEIVTDACCFHCQQAIEKLLKSFLIYKEVGYPFTHNLEYLLKKCKEIDSDFGSLDMGDLTDYAVDIRYGEDFIVPTVKETKDAYKKAIEIKGFVLNKIGIEEKDL